VSNYLWFV